ncbi:NUDIX hydrolase [Pullulanibacillus sp. KACC 23026]|uniref:NUDIX hydrolase n=1 Tax=Pullulanibacillus sp. KACC 23026 TaxID=3028315 RepID=UPI0023AFDC4A|nr:NUDIX hydrolase [Pullulanibacillus sp. KACC 23026]WEG12183.1 NUDIX hydrolase [Pullulanibacillus sp. KACC 23026]
MSYIEKLRKVVGHRPLILPGAVAIVVDDKGRLLLQQRRFPNGTWGLTGGLMELGESTEDTARREIYEETGLVVDKLHLITVHSGPKSYVKAQNGDEFYSVTIAYYAEGFTGDLAVDLDESIQFEWFYPDNLPAQMVGSHRAIINEFLAKYYSFPLE